METVASLINKADKINLVAAWHASGNIPMNKLLSDQYGKQYQRKQDQIQDELVPKWLTSERQF
jgi:hypothetical protein